MQSPEWYQQPPWRTPVLKPSSNSSLAIALITESATSPSLKILLYVLQIFQNIESTSDTNTNVIPKGPYEENAVSRKAAGVIRDN